ncbi:MAG: M48 family metallopeptidase [Nitrosomonadales bacterium]|jgi:predicted Zn-dependent protease|nr:M48 family metallopeptidase [Nitrosomonadales bacterium]MBT6818072.1 M48 family metallopeptidase [Nitrosomonadales bacterium]MBT7121332.1 M48 family metallopeptidase [Nitrosomonadales bacterium]
MKYVKNFNLAFIISILLFGCTSTTKKSDSDVDRIQLMILPEFMAMDMSQNGYTEILDNAKKDGALNVDTILVERIRGVSYNLINQTYIFRDDTQDWNWEINVIESESINAFCMPGGKIVVYSGLVNKLDATDDELAAVIGHEIAHALREHGRERMSSALVQQVGILGFAIFLSNQDGSFLSKQAVLQGVALGTTLFFALPNSREQEREADDMGLELTALAGYNPMAAVSLWRKMDAQSDSEPPEFLSTHPSNENRIEDLKIEAKKYKKLYKEHQNK